MIWTILRYWFLLTVLCLPLSLRAQVHPKLPPDDSLLKQGPLEFLADSGGQWTLNEVRQGAGLFRRTDSPRRLLGGGRPLQWLRLRLANQATQPMPLMANLGYPFLDTAQFYLLSDEGQRVIAQSGPLDWTVLPTQRPLVHRNPLFAFTLAPGQAAWLYVRVAGTSGPVVAQLGVQTFRRFQTADWQERLFWNWLFGILCWLVLVSALLGILLNERLYCYYALYVLFTAAFLIAAKGFWFEWFPARQYGFVSARHFSAQLTFIAIFVAFFFVRQYILAASWHRRGVRWVYQAGLIPVSVNFLVTGLEIIWGDWLSTQVSWVPPLISSFSLLSILIMYGLIIWQSLNERRHQPGSVLQSPAQLYLLSLVPLIGHITGNILHNYGILPGYTIPRHEGIALGYLFEFLLLSVGLGYRYKRMMDDRQHLAQVNLRQQLQLQQEQNHALQAQLRLQQEKERIARDLHDHVGAQLSVIASSLDHARMSYHLNGTAPHLEAIGNHARDAIGSLRETIWAINREHLPLAEFAIQLQQYLNRQRQVLPKSQVELRTHFTDSTQLLTSEQALNLFRIVQEGVGNALRHAHADRIQVTICTDDTNTLRLEVVDNGMGFDLNGEHPGHYGLLNMQLRAERLGGEWQVNSHPGTGTTLSLVLSLAAIFQT